MSSHSQDKGQSVPIFVPDRLALAVTSILLVAAVISWLASYYLMPLMMMDGSSGLMATSGVFFSPCI
ncbi:MAG: hypothetical protein ACREBS_07800 [Nitrososphaerales archaeon]